MRRISFPALLVLSGALAAAPKPSVHDGLEKARANAADDPASVAAFTRLAKDFGTPLYVYDQETIEARFRELKEAFGSRFPKLKVFYAVKANTNSTILSLLHRAGAGAEVVSEGEIVEARRVGVPGPEIMFTSSSKSPSEIALALSVGAVLNVDSRDELEQVEKAAAKAGKTARVSFRMLSFASPPRPRLKSCRVTRTGGTLMTVLPRPGIHAPGVEYSPSGEHPRPCDMPRRMPPISA